MARKKPGGKPEGKPPKSLPIRPPRPLRLDPRRGLVVENHPPPELKVVPAEDDASTGA